MLIEGKSMSKHFIVLVTCDQTHGTHADDLVLKQALEQEGYQIDIVSWRDGAYAWQRVALLIIRSTWDYVLDRSAFFAWLARREEEGIPIVNASDLLLWNSDKRYLRDLAASSIPILPTVWCMPQTHEVMLGLLTIALRAWSSLIIKPAVGSGSLGLRHVHTIDEGMAHLASLFSAQQFCVLLQPFLSAFVDEGEYSLIFLGNQYSHAVRKRTRTMAVLETPSPSATNVTPLDEIPPGALELARQVIAFLHRDLLFARVDVICHEGRWCVNEFELFEPQLFLNDAPSSVERAKQVVERWLKLHGQAHLPPVLVQEQ